VFISAKIARGRAFGVAPSQRLCGAHNYTVSITFSAHIMAAFEKVKLGMTEAGEGAGDRNIG
jgi:hypothetical protein